MTYAGPGATSERPTLVVADGLAARQWELTLATRDVAGDPSAWLTPPVTPYASWLESLWLQADDRRTPPLTRGQSRALWRRVIAASSEADELIGHAGVAAWAAAAWELLHRWRIDPAAERAGAEQLDYRALLGWCRDYRAALDAHGWTDRTELETGLAARLPSEVPAAVMVDFDDQYPAQALLLERLHAAAARITHERAPARAGRQRVVRLADAADELRAALAWAGERLTRAPQSRIAIVVAGLAGRQPEVERLAATAGDQGQPSGVWNGGQALAADAALGAAFNALTLLAPSTPYAAFGRWLRSRFFVAAPDELAARAALDAELRADLRSQPSFSAAYRQAGLAELLEQRLPSTAMQWRDALATAGNAPRATPSRWAHVWTRFLAQLGWEAPPPGPRLLGWQSCLDELAQLTPVLGELTIDNALRELERILDNPAPAPLPIYGVHLLGRIEQVGPGYEAAWATGFTDTFWPEAPRGNPLLPVALQRAHSMPRCTPRDTRERAARSLERLVRRVPDLVVSWPARVYDYETEPSPAVRDWPALSRDELASRTAAPSPRRARHTIADPAPPLTEPTLPGGTGMLNRQARCPLLAFCRDRLGARPLEPLAFGLPKRLRGIAVHRALERLLDGLPTQAALAALGDEALQEAAERALTGVFARTRRPLQALFELERELLRALLGGWQATERERTPFEVLAVEQRSEVQLREWTLRVRLDRLDRLADGTLAIVDYKTGERASSADWFAARLRDTQVPLYAIQTPERIGAAVIARVRSSGTSYSGLWTNGAFPGRAARSTAADWPAQLSLWRSDLEQLAAEFAAGDTRVFPDYADEAGAAYAPLTRVAELTALLRNAIEPW